MPRRPTEGSNQLNVRDVRACVVFHFHEGSPQFDVAERTDEIKREMSRLMEEHLESLRKQAFVPPDNEQIEADEKRLKRIREVSADYLAAMAREHNAQTGT